LQTVDIYDALTNPRPYKPAFSPHKALRVMQEETERGWRDPEIVKLFFTLHDSVITKAGEFTAGNDRHLEAMRSTLARLR
jgi:response regulator RpfG family c-di-GMP phosphodiesterase